MSAGRLEYDYTTTTGSWTWWPHIRYADEAGGALDAPRWIVAGCMSARTGEHVGLAVLREASGVGAALPVAVSVTPRARVFSRRRGMYSPIDGGGNWRMALWACRRYINPIDYQEWAENEAAAGSLDAVQIMPAGACVAFAGGAVGAVCHRGGK